MPTIALIAYDLNPNIGTECGKAHRWLLILAKHFSIEVFVDSKHKQDIEGFDYGSNVRFNFIDSKTPLKKYYKKLRLYNLLYKGFLRGLKPVLEEKIKKEDICLLHYITPAGIHSFNDFYKDIYIPYIVGPLGGGLKTPKGFGICRGKEFLRNFLRDIYYAVLKYHIPLKQYLLHANKIIIGTEYLLDYLPISVRQKTSIIFDTLIDTKNFPVKNKEVRGNNYIQIVYSGSLLRKKGILLLIEALKLIKERYNINDLKVIVLGDGPLYTVVKQKIKEYGVGKIVCLKGQVAWKDVVNILASSDIFCLPTLREPGGGAILEAMACGLPIITSDYGGPKYSVTDDCGIKIKVGNYKQYVSDLADAIIKLVKDEALRKRMGENARKRVEKEFSLEALEGKILKVYKEVLNEVN